MIVVKATKDTEAGKMPEEKEKLFAAMATYHEELGKAGVLLDASGLQPSSKGWRVKYSGGRRIVIDGPFTEAKEVIGGYWSIVAGSLEEAAKIAAENPCLACGLFNEVRPVERERASAFAVTSETPTRPT